MSEIKTLADLMRKRRTTNQPPYVLLLGAGASLASGAPKIKQVIDDIVSTLGGRSPEAMSDAEKGDTFYKVLDRLSSAERYSILRKYLSQAAPSAGYRHLAALVKVGYFNTLLTTNFDTFLEDSLSDTGLRARDFVVAMVGADSERLIQDAIGETGPRIRIIKLHGDLSCAFAFTPEEVTRFSAQTKSLLQDYLARDIVIVGHTMRDEEINRCVKTMGGTLWYVNPDQSLTDDFMLRVLSIRKGYVITGEYGYFDRFFGELADLLLYRPEKVSIEQEIRARDGSVIHGVSQSVEISTSGSATGMSFTVIGVPKQTTEKKRLVRDERLEKIDSLTRQMSMLCSNLETLEMRAAMYGSSTEPLHLKNQIKSVRAEITQLAEEIKQLKREAH